VALLLALAVPSTGTGNAATGGGCSAIKNFPWGYGNACIGAPRYGHGVPDAYISLSSGHPSCRVLVALVKSGGPTYTAKWFTCPIGSTYHWHVTGIPIDDTRGLWWYTYADVEFSAATYVLNHSPLLRLP
jgi:hypothetical protein